MKKAKDILTSTKKFHITLGLERVEKVLSLLGHPENFFKVIHVAGTNGKGSTCKIINQILVEKFKNTDTKIGLFTSPHLFSYTERIVVDNKKISDFIFDELVNKINDFALKNDIELSEFELITVVAFYYFYIKQVKYVVLEVGLGGLYDATNVINNSISVITDIDLDHTERLGNTIDEIAFNKAGIIKQNSKVIVSKDNKGFNVIDKIAQEKNATILEIPDVEVKFQDKNYAIFENDKMEFNLLGKYQEKNLSLALGLIKSLDFKVEKKYIKQGLKNVIHKGRLEFYKDKNLFVDGAHNPHGSLALREFLDLNYQNENKTFIFGCLKHKDYKKMLDTLIKKEDKFYLYEFNYPNALKYSDLDENLRKKAIKITNIDEIKTILSEDKNLKIITGSLYMIGSLGEILN